MNSNSSILSDKVLHTTNKITTLSHYDQLSHNVQMCDVILSCNGSKTKNVLTEDMIILL